MNNSSPQVRATTNPQEIHRAVSSPNTVYAAVEECPPEDDFTSAGPMIEESHEDDFTEEDWDNILEDVGFNSQETTEIVDNSYAEPEPESIDTEALEVVEVPTEDATTEEALPQPVAEDSLLPANSETLVHDDSTSRFSGTEWYDAIQQSRIILAGIGGIGSNVAYQIARMNPTALILYDDDFVETANMSGQMFSRDDVGKSKVEAVCTMLRKYTPMTSPLGLQKKFDRTVETGDIMICGFDNMDARYVFFTSWLKHVKSLTFERQRKCLFIDGRLSIDTLQVFAIAGDDEYNIERYREEFLFPQYQADETVCSMKQTTYLACMIGSVIVNLFTNFIANQLNPEIPYDFPFFTEYDAQNMIFKTEN